MCLNGIYIDSLKYQSPEQYQIIYWLIVRNAYG